MSPAEESWGITGTLIPDSLEPGAHLAATVCIAAAGLFYCGGAVARWRQIGQPEAPDRGSLTPVWIGLGLHSASLLLSLADAHRRDFAFTLLGLWAAVASLLFLRRFLALPSRGLLVLPVGGMALLVAMSAIAPPPPSSLAPVGMVQGGMPWIIILHVLFMVSHLACMLVAGASGGLYLLAAHQLKLPSLRTLRLPHLPLIERTLFSSLVAGTALLLGGLATGGAAVQLTRSIHFFHPTVLFALATMLVLVLLLALRTTTVLSRRTVAWGAILAMLLAALGAVSQLVVAHG